MRGLCLIRRCRPTSRPARCATCPTGARSSTATIATPIPRRPTLLLLHGWTASADLQFFTAYETLAEAYSFVAVDHRGHGRGIRNAREPFRLEDAADDAAALVEALGLGPVILVGYSMGGPISMLFWRRHPELVAGMVLEATALEWRESRAGAADVADPRAPRRHAAGLVVPAVGAPGAAQPGEGPAVAGDLGAVDRG